MQCYYYAVRFLGGNRSCTTGEPGANGRMSKAVDIEIFQNPTDRAAWIARENLQGSSGRGGGERISATRRECRKLCAGMSTDQFEQMIAAQLSELEEQCTE